MPEEVHIGVALSGGGHRAACWSAGAVLGLVDAGVAPQIVSMASVSGGSIANGLVAAGGDVRTAARADVEGWLRRGLRQWVHDGLFFPGPSTDSWIAVTLGLVAVAVGAIASAVTASVVASRDLGAATTAWTALAVVVVMVAAALGLAASVLPSPVISAGTVAGAALTWPLAFAATAASSRSAWWLLVVWPAAMLLFTGAAHRFGARSVAVERALDRTLFRDVGSLSELGSSRPVHHVFCATSLGSGNNLYLSNRLIWGHPKLTLPAGAVRLATAVQASACLPGAFLARMLDVDPSSDDGEVSLSDGGVYDNMADQWEWGFANRQRYARDLPAATALLATAQPVPAGWLVVVNASKGMDGSGTATTKPGLRGELASALGAKDVLYDVSTTTRRRLLIETFDRARHDPSTGEQGGMLVHIGTSPYQVVDRFLRADGELQQRAVDAAAVLDELAGPGNDAARRKAWRDIAAANAKVKTALSPLAPDAAASLLHHAWVLTRITAHVLHGWGELPGDDTIDDWRRARFDALVAASAEEA